MVRKIFDKNKETVLVPASKAAPTQKTAAIKKNVTFKSYVDKGFFVIKLVNGSDSKITLIRQSVEDKKSSMNKEFVNHVNDHNISIAPSNEYTILMIYPASTSQEMLDNYETYTVTYAVDDKEIYETIPTVTYAALKKAFE